MTSAPQQSAGAWRANLSGTEDLAALERKWTDVQSRAACSFFQSWGWIGSWLEALPVRRRPMALEVYLADRLVGLALLSPQPVRRHRLISSKALFLNETGDRRFDCLTVEHNGFVLDTAVGGAALREALLMLQRIGDTWDELFISAIAEPNAEPYFGAARAAQLRAFTDVRKPYYYVDCEKIRQARTDYLATLSSNTRYQVRRAMRAYEGEGEIVLRVADSPQRAEQYFEMLRTWHQQHWESRNEPGAFGSEFALQFHRTLLAKRFGAGEIQLAEISAGDAPIGYLYNFVYGGVVYNYQSAFRYSADTRYKPGLVSHCRAIQHSVDSGMKVYDLLMGSQRFKQSLATDRGEMLWLVLQKPRIRFRLEQTAVRLRDRIRAARSARARAEEPAA